MNRRIISLSLLVSLCFQNALPIAMPALPFSKRLLLQLANVGGQLNVVFPFKKDAPSPILQDWLSELKKQHAIDLPADCTFQRNTSVPHMPSYYTTTNDIYIATIDFEALEDLLETSKKRELTQQESDMLNMMTWLMLHELHHLKNKHVQKRLVARIGAMCAFEAVYLYAGKQIVTQAKKHGIKAPEWLLYLYTAVSVNIAQTLCITKYLRYQERTCDAFANAEATEAQLERAIEFLNQYAVHEESLPSFAKFIVKHLHAHPLAKERIETIQAELAKRKIQRA